MPVERTLARAEDDLRAGRVVLARQRLRGLVSSVPQRLDVREALAEVYRVEGNAAQAGRWSYLSERRDPAEVAEFEAAYGGDPVRLMGALRWRGSEDGAGTAYARERLRALRARAEERAGAPVDWTDPRYPLPPETRADKVRTLAFGLLLALAVVTLLTLAVVGFVAFVIEGFRVVLGWVR